MMQGGDYDLDDEEFDAMTQRSTSEILTEDMAEPSSPRSNYIFDCLEVMLCLFVLLLIIIHYQNLSILFSGSFLSSFI